MAKKKILLLFTVDYPFGIAEATFLGAEVEVLSRHFNSIFLIPLRRNDESTIRPLPENVSVIKIHSQNVSNNRFSALLFTFFVIIKEGFFCKSLNYFANLRFHLSEYLEYLRKADMLQASLKTKGIRLEECVCYTYWFDEWTTILSAIKERTGTNVCLVSRAHGYDLYSERSARGYIFPRHHQLKMIDRVFTISENGSRYLKKKFPQFAEKITFSRLGISDPGHKIIAANTGSDTEETVIASCSMMIKLKRLEKIVDILRNCKKPTRWIHFGSGELFDQMVSMVQDLPNHIRVEFKGHVNNSEIKKYYAEHRVDWFINVSEYEGIPVSMMEAISFGIPIIGTNVGGVSEIANEITGFLIDKEVNPRQVADIVENHRFDSEQREIVRSFWRSHYSAESNYSSFARELSDSCP